jgi:uncharacterized protein YndB with AHSA1/START domain
MPDLDLTKFVKRISIHVPPHAIYDAWSTQEGLESWFLRDAIFSDSSGRTRAPQEKIQQDDSYEWRWHGYPDSTNEKNKVLAANGSDFLKFGFAGPCVVTVSIKQEAGETVCELTQSNFPDNEEERLFLHFDCGTGWTFYLANLKSILEGGIDLRNKNENIRQVINS